MKRLSKICAAVLVCLLVTGVAFAKGGRGGPGGPGGGPGEGGGSGMAMGKWWQKAEIINKMGLTEEQVAKIDEISKKGRRENIKLRSELQLIRFDMDSILESENVDQSAAKDLIDKFVNIRSELEKNRMMTLLGIRKILTREQYLQLREFRGNRGKMGGNRKGPGMGKGNRQLRKPE